MFYKGWKYYFRRGYYREDNKKAYYILRYWDVENGRYTQKALNEFFDLMEVNWNWEELDFNPCEITQTGRVLVNNYAKLPERYGKTKDVCLFYGLDKDGTQHFYMHRSQEKDNIENLISTEAPNTKNLISNLNLTYKSFGVGFIIKEGCIWDVKTYFQNTVLPADFWNRLEAEFGSDYKPTSLSELKSDNAFFIVFHEADLKNVVVYLKAVKGDLDG